MNPERCSIIGCNLPARWILGIHPGASRVCQEHLNAYLLGWALSTAQASERLYTRIVR